MKPLRYLPHYTYDDYKLWEGDWELIQGIPYSMSPSPVWNHQLLSARLITLISTSLTNKKSSCNDCSVVHDVDWIIDDDTIVRPDIMFVCGKVTTPFLKFPPTLIVEILSPGTAIKDRTLKFDIYEQQKVKYYLLADPVSQTLKIFMLTDNGYIESTTAVFNLKDKCKLNLDIAAIVKAKK